MFQITGWQDAELPTVEKLSEEDLEALEQQGGLKEKTLRQLSTTLMLTSSRILFATESNFQGWKIGGS